MMLLDPFYGVFKPGVTIAKWLNRALLLYEVASIATLLHFLYSRDLVPLWVILAAIPASFLVIHVVNLILRGLWNIVVVFVYGTTDADTILESRQAKQDRKRTTGIRKSSRNCRKIPAGEQLLLLKPEDYYPVDAEL